MNEEVVEKEKNMKNENQVKRNLKQRHITMIALGGTIGTGLFLTSGATISQAGPFGAVQAAHRGHGLSCRPSPCGGGRQKADG